MIKVKITVAEIIILPSAVIILIFDKIGKVDLAGTICNTDDNPSTKCSLFIEKRIFPPSVGESFTQDKD